MTYQVAIWVTLGLLVLIFATSSYGPNTTGAPEALVNVFVTIANWASIVFYKIGDFFKGYWWLLLLVLFVYVALKGMGRGGGKATAVTKFAGWLLILITAALIFLGPDDTLALRNWIRSAILPTSLKSLTVYEPMKAVNHVTVHPRGLRVWVPKKTPNKGCIAFFPIEKLDVRRSDTSEDSTYVDIFPKNGKEMVATIYVHPPTNPICRRRA